MNGYDRNFDLADYLVGIYRDQRRTKAGSGNEVAIYQYLGIIDGMEITDAGVTIAQADTGRYGTGHYGLCVYG